MKFNVKVQKNFYSEILNLNAVSYSEISVILNLIIKFKKNKLLFLRQKLY